MTNQFHNDEHSTCFALLFDSHAGVEHYFKARTKDYPYSIIKDKEEKRISSMLVTAGQLGAQMISFQKSAINAIAIAKSYEEALAVEMGLLPIVPSGLAICPTCLEKTILACEENIAVLKDIQEAVKEYVK